MTPTTDLLVDSLIAYKYSILSFITCWGLFFASDIVFARLFLFYNKELSKGDRAEWGSRVVSTIHALLVTIVASYVLSTDARVRNDLVSGYNMLQDWNLRILIGYMSYDLLLVLGTKQLRSIGSVIHHLLCLVGAFSCLGWHQLQLVTVLLTCTEITTPFVNMRWFLAAAKETSSTAYLVNGILMTLGFLTIRAVALPSAVFYAICTQWAALQEISGALMAFLFICVTGLPFLNTYWTYLMVKGLMHHLDKRKAPSDSKKVN